MNLKKIRKKTFTFTKKKRQKAKTMKVVFRLCFAAPAFGTEAPKQRSGPTKLLPQNYTQHLNIQSPEL